MVLMLDKNMVYTVECMYRLHTERTITMGPGLTYAIEGMLITVCPLCLDLCEMDGERICGECADARAQMTDEDEYCDECGEPIGDCMCDFSYEDFLDRMEE